MIPVTALIITYNEEANIGRTLAALANIERLLIVDSFSNDRTIELVKTMAPRALVLQREFKTFADQCNFALGQITTEWALSLDADYVMTPELISEIEKLNPSADISGYSVNFRYCIKGHPLRATLYPPRTVLYRQTLVQYRDEGHGHRVVIKGGKIDKLVGKIDHDDRKPLTRWFDSQNRYSIVEAKHLLARSSDRLPIQDRLRKCILIAPLVMPIYLLVFRGLVLDGLRGWFYVVQRTIAELLLSLRLLALRIGVDAN